ncbi:hypothetical protein RCAP_rcc03003 [Rhodobacter capsulatus SB 1003]|uniref:Uncharacterized protein n=1 Tax=Rhodobacter capsulatus (strain ATCC BAA-309 / NBRC 16581 / SB1003) TaxID=272942 RepID=D5AQE1_RHOCB|nr:hypothetical protein RCAP_rcc03003 [Rhodobacter capsulatus SB 1003]
MFFRLGLSDPGSGGSLRVRFLEHSSHMAKAIALALRDICPKTAEGPKGPRPAPAPRHWRALLARRGWALASVTRVETVLPQLGRDGRGKAVPFRFRPGCGLLSVCRQEPPSLPNSFKAFAASGP